MSMTRAITLSEAVLPRRGILLNAALVLGFSLIIALSARISFSFPGTAVPFSGQTLAVLLAGAVLGSRRGALSVMSYLAYGAMGAPVFAFSAYMGYGGGIARFTGPTGGYLIGFIAVAFVVGFLAERGWDRRIWTTALAMLIGEVVLYAFGLSWLAHFHLAGSLSGLSLDLARFDPTGWVLAMGLYPFVIGDLIKLIIAAIALPSAWSLLSRLQR